MKIGDLVKINPHNWMKDGNESEFATKYYGAQWDLIRGRVLGIQGELPPNGGFVHQSTFILVKLHDGILIDGEDVCAFLLTDLMIDLENTRNEKLEQLGI